MTPEARPALPPRLRREARTIELMIRMYCRGHHHGAAGAGEAGRPGGAGAADRGPAGLCPSCSALLDYSLERVAACRFGQAKPVCDRCPVHCFRPSMREQIRAVMRYAGPRMTLRHPYLAVRHLLDRRAARKSP